MARISDRIGSIAESATMATDSKLKAMAKAGMSVVNFTAGEPDFPTPDEIVEAAADACRNPANHRYTSVLGLDELRQAIAAKTARDSGYGVEAAQVLVTNGGKQAVYEAYATLLDPGDEVLLPSPYWVTYPEVIRLAGGVPVEVPAEEDTKFRVTVDDLEAARTERTKVLNFVSPSNPTGSVYPRDEVEAIGRWAVENDIWVVTDEIYEHLVYGTNKHYSMPVLVPELAERSVVINGVAKTYAMTGWRVGWMIASADIIKAAASLQGHSTSNVANVSQRAAIAALTGDLSAVAMMREAFDVRRQKMVELLSEIPGVACVEPEGAFYCFPSFKAIVGTEIAGHTPKTTLELAELLLDEVQVGIVPGEAFGAPGYARLSYALGDDDLVEGLTRLAKLLAG